MGVDKELSMRDRSYARQRVGQDVRRHRWIEVSYNARPRSGERSYGDSAHALASVATGTRPTLWRA